NLLAVRATVGARMNRFELIRYRLEADEVNVTRLLSKEEDADMAEVITNLKTAENVYRAALAAGARIIQPSLVDFLR
ncbi:MAG TPA: flagellin, partial [Calditerricola sp.]